jgi:hypothetical protein
VAAIEPAGDYSGDEKLRTVGVLSGVCHALIWSAHHSFL